MAAVGEEALPAPVPPEGPLRAAANPRALATAVREVEAGLSARRDDPAGASALLLRAARRPALGDWARALAAEAAARTGDVEGARAALSWLPTDLALSWGFRAEALALLEAGEPAAAVGAAVAGLGRSRTGPDSAAARWLAGRALVETGDTAAARRHLRQGARGAPGAVGTARSAEALERLGSLSDEDRLALVLYRVRRGDLTVAGRALDGMVRDGTAGPVVAEASLELARALSFRGRHEEGERVAARAIPGSPGPAAAALHVEVARARLRGRSDAPARPPLEAAVEAAPSSPAAQAALFILADLDEDAGEPERARARFARAADLDPTTDVGGEAAVREGLLALSAGDIRGAVLRFDAYRAAHPTGWRAQQATYWAAVARLRAGDGEDALSLLAAARDVDPTGYYALRAADRSGPGGPDPLAGLPDPPPPDPVEARLAQGAVARVEAL